jgi:hypothetical protein
MASSDWGNGLPIEIMSNIMGIIVNELDGEAFTASAQVNKCWNATFKPVKVIDINVTINDATDIQLYSATKIFIGVRFLTLNGLEKSPGLAFNIISRGFTELVTLDVKCDLDFTSDDAYSISTLSNLKELSLEVAHYRSRSIMRLRHMGLAKFYAYNSYNRCAIKVDSLASYHDKEELTEIDMHNFIPDEVTVFKKFGKHYDSYVSPYYN